MEDLDGSNIFFDELSHLEKSIDHKLKNKMGEKGEYSFIAVF